MTAPVRDLPPYLAAILPGLRGDGPIRAAEFPAAIRALTVTTPATPIPTSTTATLFGGASTSAFRRTLPDLMRTIPMTGGVLQVPTFTQGANGGAPHAEGLAKLEAALVFAGGLAKAASVATWVSVTDELLDDAAGLDAWLSSYLSFLVGVAEEREILVGTGVSPRNVVGFFVLPGVQAYAGSMTDDVEVVAHMIGQAAATSGIVPDTVVVSASIWAGLVKSGSNVFDADAQTFAGCDVVVSSAITDAQILVGPVQALAVLGREGGVLVEGTRSHASDFVSNKATIRAASRIALGVLLPSAFVKKG